MAELLILARDAEAVKDKHKDNGWTKGDVVAVMPDGHRWGKRECPPRFYIVKVPGADVKEFADYATSRVIDTGLVEPDGKTPILRMIAPRNFKIDINELPGDAKGSLDRAGIAELNERAAKGTIKEKTVKDDGRREIGNG